MSGQNKELVVTLSDELNLGESVLTLEKSLTLLGMMGTAPEQDLGSDETDGKTTPPQRIKRKLRIADPDRFADSDLNRLGQEMLRQLNRQYEETNARVNLILRCTLAIYGVQFLVLAAAAVLLMMNRLKLDVLKGIGGVLPGAVGGAMHFYYRSERTLLAKLEHDRGVVYTKLLHQSGLTPRRSED